MNLHLDALLLVLVHSRLGRFAAAFRGVQPDTDSCRSFRLSFTITMKVKKEVQAFQLDQRKGLCSCPRALQDLGQSESEPPDLASVKKEKAGKFTPYTLTQPSWKNPKRFRNAA